LEKSGSFDILDELLNLDKLTPSFPPELIRISVKFNRFFCGKVFEERYLEFCLEFDFFPLVDLFFADVFLLLVFLFGAAFLFGVFFFGAAFLFGVFFFGAVFFFWIRFVFFAGFLVDFGFDLDLLDVLVFLAGVFLFVVVFFFAEVLLFAGAFLEEDLLVTAFFARVDFLEADLDLVFPFFAILFVFVFLFCFAAAAAFAFAPSLVRTICYYNSLIHI